MLTQQNDQYVLVDPTVGETVSSLGSIIVYDSAGEITLGTMTAQTILAGQKYGITISVDQEFLAGAAYPVSIDPTITFQTGTTGVIEDLGLYNHADAWGSTFDEMPYVGKTVINNYTGALMYRFPFIYDSTESAFGGSPGNPLFTAAQVGKATLRINVSRSSSTAVTLNMKKSNVTWSATMQRICDAAVFESAMSGSNLLSSPVSTPQSGTVDLDLTKIMRDWISFEAGVSTKADPEKGVLLYSNHPSVSLAVNSIRGYDATKYPSLIIEYITQEQTGPYYLNNKGNQSFLTYTEDFEVGMARGRVADLGTSMEWVLSYQGDGKYALSPSDYESIWYLNYSGGLSLCTGNPVTHSTWTVMTDNTDFVFRNVYYPDTALSYTTDVYTMIDNVGCNELAETVTSINDTAVTTPFKWRMIHKSAYVEFPLITLTEIALEPEQVDMYEYLNADNYSLTDPSSDLYIYGVGGTTCTVVNGVITPVTPGGSFTINVNHRPSAQFVSFTVYIMPLAEGMYFIKNKEIGKYMQIDNDDEPGHNTSGSIMELWGYDGGDYQKWNVIYIGNGYYTISSVKSGLALSVPSGSTDDSEVALVQESYSSTSRMMWKITKLSTGSYVLRPKSGEDYDSDWCMCAGNQFLGVTDGLNVEQRTYDDNDIYKDEWFFEFDTTSDSSRLPHPDAQNKTHWCWAASAKMVGEHNGGDGALNRTPALLTHTIEDGDLHSYNWVLFYGETSEGDITADGGQREIVVKVRGNDGNHFGSNDYIEEALQIASFRDMNIDTLGTVSLTTQDITSMNSELSAGRWVVGTVFVSGAEHSHAIVIQSYDTTTQRYTFWDPWTDGSGTFSMTQLLNNTIHIAPGTENYILACIQYCN